MARCRLSVIVAVRNTPMPALSSTTCLSLVKVTRVARAACRHQPVRIVVREAQGVFDRALVHGADEQVAGAAVQQERRSGQKGIWMRMRMDLKVRRVTKDGCSGLQPRPATFVAFHRERPHGSTIDREASSEIGAGSRGASMGMAGLRVAAWKLGGELFGHAEEASCATERRPVRGRPFANAHHIDGSSASRATWPTRVYRFVRNGIFPIVVGATTASPSVR